MSYSGAIYFHSKSKWFLLAKQLEVVSADRTQQRLVWLLTNSHFNHLRQMRDVRDEREKERRAGDVLIVSDLIIDTDSKKVRSQILSLEAVSVDRERQKMRDEKR